MRFARAAVALGVAAFCFVAVVPGCGSSDAPSPDASFCGTSQSSLGTCPPPMDGSSCDATLTTSCASLVAVLSPSALTRASDCLESGICGVTACLTRTQKNVEPTEAHRALAASFCASCAPDVADCEAQFYARSSKLPGQLLLPYAEPVVQAVEAACTGTRACRSSFVGCATETIASEVAAAVDVSIADCVSTAFQRDDTGGTGPNGTVQVARCTAANCPGCCRDDRCEEGKSTSACGKAGEACETCSGIASCTDGACKEPCSENNCTGCCDGDTCVAGGAKDECGTGGAACSACAGALVCSKGTCIDGSCRANCTNGCCSATGCQTGTARNACGKGGEACVDCGAGRTCSSGACVLDRTSLWDFYVSFAEIPEKSRSNNPWDAFNGLPDPYLLAFASEGAATASGKTTAPADTLVPIWMETPLTKVKASTFLENLSFEIWDEDTLDPDDYIGGCKLPITVDKFDGSLQTFTCGPGPTRGVSVTLWYRIRPSAP